MTADGEVEITRSHPYLSELQRGQARTDGYSASFTAEMYGLYWRVFFGYD